MRGADNRTIAGRITRSGEKLRSPDPKTSLRSGVAAPTIGGMRRYLCLLIVSALSASLLVAAPAAVASPDGSAGAAAYNKKKCRKAKTKRAKKKYCKKKQAPQTGTGTQTQTGTGTQTQTGTGTQTGTATGTPTDPNAQVVRDDAGFTNAFVGSHFRKYSEGTYGYGEYNWDFCQGGSWLYKSYYSVAGGGAPESNNSGSYTVEAGYHAAADPSYYGGTVLFTDSAGKQYRFGIEVRGSQGYVKTNHKDFEQGTYSVTPGAAQC
jgi:hypothetical protein